MCISLVNTCHFSGTLLPSYVNKRYNSNMTECLSYFKILLYKMLEDACHFYILWQAISHFYENDTILLCSWLLKVIINFALGTYSISIRNSSSFNFLKPQVFIYFGSVFCVCVLLIQYTNLWPCRPVIKPSLLTILVFICV